VVDELIGLYKRILSSPEARSRDIGTVKTAFTSDRTVRGEIHQNVRRIFQGKVDSSTDHDGMLVLSAALPYHRRPANQPGQNQWKRDHRPTWADRGGEHIHFTLYKENKDTMEVIFFLKGQLKTNVKTFQFAGTKDRRAVTVQRVSAHRVEAERLAGLNKVLRNSSVGDFEYQKYGLELGDLKGNEFLITLRDCHFEFDMDLSSSERIHRAQTVVETGLRNLRDRGFFNYFGLQRFGTFATRTDTIGIKLLQGDFKGACDDILDFSPSALAAAQDPDSTELIGWDDKARAEGIQIFKTTGSVNEALDKLPKKFSAEVSIIRHLGKHKSDYAGALMTIQRNLRLMYVHAYQSLVWNLAVSERWKLYGDKVVEGDLVMVNEHKHKFENGTAHEEIDADGELVIQPSFEDRAHTVDDVFERARALTSEEAASSEYNIFDVVLPQPGFDIIYPKNAMDDWYKAFMGSERGGRLNPYDMRRKQKDYSLSGGYRKILARIEPEYSAEVRTYTNDDEQFVKTDLELLKENDDKDIGDNSNEENQASKESDKIAVILKFQLRSSQYATMALRELSKGGIVAHKPDFSAGR
jgi:tRNA pseudouridine13 synthase